MPFAVYCLSNTASLSDGNHANFKSPARVSGSACIPRGNSPNSIAFGEPMKPLGGHFDSRRNVMRESLLALSSGGIRSLLVLVLAGLAIVLTGCDSGVISWN